MDISNTYDSLTELSEDETNQLMHNWQLQQKQKPKHKPTTTPPTASMSTTNNTSPPISANHENKKNKMPYIVAYNTISKNLVDALNI